MKRISIVLTAIAALLAAAALSGVGRPEAARSADGTSHGVTVTGHGVVTGVPDTALVSFGVRTSAATAAAALAENAARMQKVVAALEAGGAKDVQTQQVSLYPHTRESGRVDGYDAENTVSAKSPVAQAGALVDAAVGAGANIVDGPSLSLSDRDARYRDALGRAVADARRKAEALAAAGGFGVGPVTAVLEQNAGAPVYADASARMAQAATTPVVPGKREVSADVSVTFALR